MKVVRAAPDNTTANQMRAIVLYGVPGHWEVGPRLAAQLKRAATHYERAAAFYGAGSGGVDLARIAVECRGWAEAMSWREAMSRAM